MEFENKNSAQQTGHSGQICPARRPFIWKNQLEQSSKILGTALGALRRNDPAIDPPAEKTHFRLFSRVDYKWKRDANNTPLSNKKYAERVPLEKTAGTGAVQIKSDGLMEWYL